MHGEANKNKKGIFVKKIKIRKALQKQCKLGNLMSVSGYRNELYFVLRKPKTFKFT